MNFVLQHSGHDPHLRYNYRINLLRGRPGAHVPPFSKRSECHGNVPCTPRLPRTLPGFKKQWHGHMNISSRRLRDVCMLNKVPNVAFFCALHFTSHPTNATRMSDASIQGGNGMTVPQGRGRTTRNWVEIRYFKMKNKWQTTQHHCFCSLFLYFVLG